MGAARRWIRTPRLAALSAVAAPEHASDRAHSWPQRLGRPRPQHSGVSPVSDKPTRFARRGEQRKMTPRRLLVNQCDLNAVANLIAEESPRSSRLLIGIPVSAVIASVPALLRLRKEHRGARSDALRAD